MFQDVSLALAKLYSFQSKRENHNRMRSHNQRLDMLVKPTDELLVDIPGWKKALAWAAGIKVAKEKQVIAGAPMTLTMFGTDYNFPLGPQYVCGLWPETDADQDNGLCLDPKVLGLIVKLQESAFPGLANKHFSILTGDGLQLCVHREENVFLLRRNDKGFTFFDLFGPGGTPYIIQGELRLSLLERVYEGEIHFDDKGKIASYDPYALWPLSIPQSALTSGDMSLIHVDVAGASIALEPDDIILPPIGLSKRAQVGIEQVWAALVVNRVPKDRPQVVVPQPSAAPLPVIEPAPFLIEDSGKGRTPEAEAEILRKKFGSFFTPLSPQDKQDIEEAVRYCKSNRRGADNSEYLRARENRARNLLVYRLREQRAEQRMLGLPPQGPAQQIEQSAPNNLLDMPLDPEEFLASSPQPLPSRYSDFSELSAKQPEMAGKIRSLAKERGHNLEAAAGDCLAMLAVFNRLCQDFGYVKLDSGKVIDVFEKANIVGITSTGSSFQLSNLVDLRPSLNNIWAQQGDQIWTALTDAKIVDRFSGHVLEGYEKNYSLLGRELRTLNINPKVDANRRNLAETVKLLTGQRRCFYHSAVNGGDEPAFLVELKGDLTLGRPAVLSRDGNVTTTSPIVLLARGAQLGMDLSALYSS